MEDEVEVRAPMEYKYERLIEPERRPRGRPRKVTRSSIKQEENEIVEGILNLDIENAMRQSMLEFQEEESRKHKEEQEKIEKEREKRLETLSKFSNIRHQMKRVGAFDKDIQELNLLLGPLIEQYSENTNQVFTFDKNTYDMIMKNIKSIRLKKEEIELLVSILRSE